MRWSTPIPHPCSKAIPALAQLHLIDRGWKRQGVWRQAAAEWALISALRARHYDLVVHLSVHTRGAWLVRLLRPRWSVAPKYTEGFWVAQLQPSLPGAVGPAAAHRGCQSRQPARAGVRAGGGGSARDPRAWGEGRGARRRLAGAKRTASPAASSMFIPPRAGPSSAGPRRASPRCAMHWRRKACR
jgi:hypothetical protein